MPQILTNEQIAERLPHRRYDEASCQLWAGKRGQGKTHGMRRYLEAREPRVFALDAFGDFTGLTLASGPETALRDLSFGTPCRRRIVPPIGNSSRLFADWLFNEMIEGEFPLRNCTLVLDEMTLWSKMVASPALEALILQGRRFGLKLVMGCQRISLVPGVCLSEATEMILFRMTRPRDLDVVAEWADDETATIVKKLRPRLCVVVSL